jgi:glycerol-3-phosphate dehydrogenase
MTTQSAYPDVRSLDGSAWDLVVIGGGITGAGVFREAAHHGFRVLLVEARDFSSGTSSRSAKLVHGGLHYLARLQVGLAREAIRERDCLLRSGPGLVSDLPFILATIEHERIHNRMAAVGVGLYEAFAGRLHRPRHVDSDRMAALLPGLSPEFSDGLIYGDAQTDDARLVLRVIREGRDRGGVALNDARVIDFARNREGRVYGVVLEDGLDGSTAEVRARCVVNATGPWSDLLRAKINHAPRTRLVRGSHIFFPREVLPISLAVAVRHPGSGLPIYFVPWENLTLVGTTHVDHGESPNVEPRASDEEIGYLLEGVQAIFPGLALSSDNIQAAAAGLRVIVDTHRRDAAHASRDYAIWEQDGLISIAGGKLTTFRSMAQSVLRLVGRRLSHPNGQEPCEPLATLPKLLDSPLAPEVALSMLARYGEQGLTAIGSASPNELERIPGQSVRWAELRWAARAEDVHHLDDLLLRRVRLGLTAPQGAIPLLEEIRPVVQGELGWSDARWAEESDAYRIRWDAVHRVGVSERVKELAGVA